MSVQFKWDKLNWVGALGEKSHKEMAESGGKRKASGVLPHRSGRLRRCMLREEKGGDRRGVAFSPPPPSSGPLAP